MKYDLHLDRRGDYHLVDNARNIVSAIGSPDINKLLSQGNYAYGARDDHRVWYPGYADTWLIGTPTTIVYSFNSIDEFINTYPECFV